MWQRTLPTPVHYILCYNCSTHHTASLFRGAARNMSSTLRQNDEIRHYLNIQQLLVLPDDHLCGFTGTNNDLPLEFVALGHPKLLHRTDGSLFHV